MNHRGDMIEKQREERTRLKWLHTERNMMNATVMWNAGMDTIMDHLISSIVPTILPLTYTIYLVVYQQTPTPAELYKEELT